MKKILIPIATALLLASTSFSVAGDAAAGKKISATCNACHGQNGISNMPQNPNLAGQKEAYLVTQLKAFRDGSRNNAMMSAMVRSLTDKNIDDLAAHYSSM
jgi:cytochrome c553